MKVNKNNLPVCKECAIRSSSLFGELDLKHIDKMQALRSVQLTFEAGEYLYHEGDTPDKAFTVYDGWVVLFKDMKNGDRQILRFALPGDFLCYKVGNNKVVDHSAIAVSKATLCAFPIERFHNAIADLPELAFAISSITDRMTQRCHIVLTSIASHPAESKVAFLLLSLFVREESLSAVDTDCVPFPITQEDIADALGLTSIHVNRVLQSLRKSGMIECKNRCLWVPDKKALAIIAKITLPELEHLMLGI